MKLAMALKSYLEGDLHVPGKPVGSLMDLKVLMGENTDASIAELESYDIGPIERS